LPSGSATRPETVLPVVQPLGSSSSALIAARSLRRRHARVPPTPASTAAPARPRARPGAAPPSEDPEPELLATAGDAATLAWQATGDAAARGASGDVVWSPSQQRGYMRFRGLAPNDPKVAQYQLWIFDKLRDDRFPVDGGVFDVTSGGELIVPISAKLPVGDAALFAVTVEAPGGVVVSKRERIVVTAAPAEAG
jgi:hypothetical protein